MHILQIQIKVLDTEINTTKPFRANLFSGNSFLSQFLRCCSMWNRFKLQPNRKKGFIMHIHRCKWGEMSHMTAPPPSKWANYLCITAQMRFLRKTIWGFVVFAILFPDTAGCSTSTSTISQLTRAPGRLGNRLQLIQHQTMAPLGMLLVWQMTIPDIV